MRIYAGVFLGPHGKSQPEMAYRSISLANFGSLGPVGCTSTETYSIYRPDNPSYSLTVRQYSHKTSVFARPLYSDPSWKVLTVLLLIPFYIT